MGVKQCDIIFSGKLLAGSKPPEVLGRLSNILGLAEPQIRELFKSGSGAVIAKGLDGAKASELRDRLQAAGVVCTISERELPSPPEPRSSGMETMGAPRSDRRQPDVTPRWQPPVMPQRQGPGVFSQVFKMVVLAAIAAGGWWGYQAWFATPTPTFVAYAGFADAMVRGEYQKAYDESRGTAREFADSWIQMTRPTTMKVYGKEFVMSPPSVSSIAGDIAWIKRKKKREEKKTDSRVELQVEQTVCRIPPGVTSALCKWPVTFQHDVVLEQIDGAWRVSGFKELRLTPQDK